MENPEDSWDFNPLQKKRIAWLVAGFLEKTLTQAEKKELDDWINASETNQHVFEDLIDTEKLKAGFTQLDSLDINAARKRIDKLTQPRHPVFLKSGWLKYAAAAAIILSLGIGLYYFSSGKKINKENIAAVTTDIQPGTNKATLLLADGSLVNLEDVPTGIIRENIKKTKDGELDYNPSATEAVQYNTLTTPQGGQYSVKLPDGSKVTLNASSSLRYPLSFTSANRLVELTGEAWFEVSKDAGKPFIVQSNKQKVEVLGTHFNINAYADEPFTITTLAEGKVKVIADGKEKILAPGQQSLLNEQLTLKIQEANLQEATAWKDGYFEFSETPLPVIMRQIARWYNAEIIYEAKLSLHFNASIPRSVPVSKLLRLLEKTGELHFSVNGNKIIVKP